MQHYFNACPDCGEEYGKIGNMPELDRYEKFYNGNDIIKSSIKAICNRCEWETKLHDNVKECADEWNSTVIYDKNKTCVDCKYFCESDGFGCKNRWLAYEDNGICEDFIEKQ